MLAHIELGELDSGPGVETAGVKGAETSRAGLFSELLQFNTSVAKVKAKYRFFTRLRHRYVEFVAMITLSRVLSESQKKRPVDRAAEFGRLEMALRLPRPIDARPNPQHRTFLAARVSMSIAASPLQ